MEALDAWVGRQYRHAAAAMLGSYDPEPDYFFPWYRDSALVVDALRVLHEDAVQSPDTLAHFADFVRFSLSPQFLGGRAAGAARYGVLHVISGSNFIIRAASVAVSGPRFL